MSVQPPSRYTDGDNRDWRGRSAQFSPASEEKSWESSRDSREFGRVDSKLANQNNSSQFARAQFSANQVVTISIIGFVG